MERWSATGVGGWDESSSDPDGCWQVPPFAPPGAMAALRAELGRVIEGVAGRHQDPGRPGAVPVAITFFVLPAAAADAQGWAGERIF